MTTTTIDTIAIIRALPTDLKERLYSLKNMTVREQRWAVLESVVDDGFETSKAVAMQLGLHQEVPMIAQLEECDGVDTLAECISTALTYALLGVSRSDLGLSEIKEKSSEEKYREAVAKLEAEHEAAVAKMHKEHERRMKEIQDWFNKPFEFSFNF